MYKKVDYHVHTTFSDGGGTYEDVLNKAKLLGLECIAITDHFDKYDPKEMTNSIIEEDLVIHFCKIREYAARIGQKVLCGVETCTDFKGNLRLSDTVMRNCDIIITSPHYVEYDGEVISGHYFDPEYWNIYKEKVINMASGDGDVLGHSESYLPYGHMLIPNTTNFDERQQLSRAIADEYFDKEYIDALIQALKYSGKALELHCITKSPREWVIELVTDSNIAMSLGSDAHELKAVGTVEWGMNMLNKYKGLQFLVDE